VRSIDLTHLAGGLTPTLPRNALVAEIEVYGRKVVFASVHLDHGADSTVRLAQAEKLVRELTPGAGSGACSILAGDFNDVEESPVVRYLASAGYVDAYRACHKAAGATYPAGDPSARIDYIFVKGHTAIASSGLLANDPELSDHIAIFAEVR
jgi:endonuclease/exonuclease/phosphatase family metal-dependent hydrolase